MPAAWAGRVGIAAVLAMWVSWTAWRIVPALPVFPLVPTARPGDAHAPRFDPGQHHHPFRSACPGGVVIALHVSDIHISAARPDPALLRDLTSLATGAVAHAINASTVLVSGDMVDAKHWNGWRSRQVTAEWEKYWAAVRDGGARSLARGGDRARWIDIPGNHCKFNQAWDRASRGLVEQHTHTAAFTPMDPIFARGAATWSLPANTRGDEIAPAAVAFVPLDAAPQVGPSRPFNFFGHYTAGAVDAAERAAADVRRTSVAASDNAGPDDQPPGAGATEAPKLDDTAAPGGVLPVLVSHYPRCVTTSSASASGKPLWSAVRNGVRDDSDVRTPSLLITGHLHTLLGLAPRMYARHRDGTLELEIGDFKEHRRFRVMVFDGAGHRSFAFADAAIDPETGEPPWPLIVPTNPADARFALAGATRGLVETSTFVRAAVFSDAEIVSVTFAVRHPAVGPINLVQHADRGRDRPRCRHAHSGGGSTDDESGPLFAGRWDPATTVPSGTHTGVFTATDARGRTTTVTVPFTTGGAGSATESGRFIDSLPCPLIATAILQLDVSTIVNALAFGPMWLSAALLMLAWARKFVTGRIANFLLNFFFFAHDF
jgi:hypothetical protein